MSILNGDLMGKRIAVIPARGGSKRLPRKNILPLNERPLISYPIQSAIESELFDSVVVSTEDQEIAEIAARYNAAIDKRPDSLAGDRSTVVQVCEHVLQLPEYATVELFCCIYATAAFITPADLKKSFQLLDNPQPADFVMGVSEYNYSPVQALKKEDGYLKSMWPEYNKMQSQFYPELVVSNGTLYWGRRNPFLEELTFYGRRTVGYLVPHERAIDIDTPADYEKAVRLAGSM